MPQTRTHWQWLHIALPSLTSKSCPTAKPNTLQSAKENNPLAFFLCSSGAQNIKEAKSPPQWAYSLKETIIFYADSQIFFPEPILLLTTLNIEKSVRAFLGKAELKEEFGFGTQEVGFCAESGQERAAF